MGESFLTLPKTTIVIDNGATVTLLPDENTIHILTMGDVLVPNIVTTDIPTLTTTSTPTNNLTPTTTSTPNNSHSEDNGRNDDSKDNGDTQSVVLWVHMIYI